MLKQRRRPHSSGRTWTKVQLAELHDGFYADLELHLHQQQQQQKQVQLQLQQQKQLASAWRVRRSDAWKKDNGSRPETPRSARQPRQASSLRSWLVSVHGSLLAAFEAIDVDQDGYIDTSDLLDELARNSGGACTAGILSGAAAVARRWGTGPVGHREFAEALMDKADQASSPDSERPQQSESSQVAAVYVFHMPTGWTETDLLHLFESFGTVTSSHVLRDACGLSRRCGFVTFTSSGVANHACEMLNGFAVDGARLRVSLTSLALAQMRPGHLSQLRQFDTG